MAAVAPSSDQLSLDSQSKPLEIPEPTKRYRILWNPSVDTADAGNAQNQPLDRSVTPLIPDFMDPTVAYFPNYASTAYYYGGYDGTTNDWEDYSRYINPEGVDMSHVRLISVLMHLCLVFMGTMDHSCMAMAMHHMVLISCYFTCANGRS
ncbi:hypothetical protein OSB04_010026 [Centaurea solstitialis]|uniref:Uncharacterized protein n=1 Tax=Centaurea solstitialis TaxID=347529 RepID=A0AA38WBH7_9ASTR|nr:hypothetical protein OSB04_010026 [Centaurea solstitialis]